MRINLAKFLESLSVAVDYVEKEILDVAPYHGQRVAAITYKIAHDSNLDEDKLFAITQAALLHDCALNEYFEDEKPNEIMEVSEKNMALHCFAGEKILSKMPFYESVKNAILYHHERADGKGAYGKKTDEIPYYARLIHLADVLDVNWSLSEKLTKKKYDDICSWVSKNAGTIIDYECTYCFFKFIDFDFLQKITGENVLTYLRNSIPYKEEEIPNEAMIDLCSIFADITDYKSHFTWRHSLGVADKAKRMAEFYNYSEADCQKLYIAGALHDIGKLMINNNILEKPGKLSSDEYKAIQNHAMGSYKLLEDISGLEEINRIASLHHEKLDGSGYPFGYKADQLSKNERLMACIDIYQALVEERPYKKGLEHSAAMQILIKMSNDGQLDKDIVQDIDKCFKTEKDSIALRNNSVPSVNKDISDNLKGKEVWRCPVCGYMHEGSIPDDFICPRCEQPACIFEKLN